MSNSNEVKVFANISDDPVSFETVQDFNRYYERNKEFVDGFSTRGLNKKFIITGYRIGRKKGDIILYPVQTHRETSPEENNFEERNMLEEKIDSMNERLKKIEQLLNILLNNSPVQQQRSSQNHSSRQFYN